MAHCTRQFITLSLTSCNNGYSQSDTFLRLNAKMHQFNFCLPLYDEPSGTSLFEDSWRLCGLDAAPFDTCRITFQLDARSSSVVFTAPGNAREDISRLVWTDRDRALHRLHRLKASTTGDMSEIFANTLISLCALSIIEQISANLPYDPCPVWLSIHVETLTAC